MLSLSAVGLDVTQGDIRLVGGTDQWEGRVEIFLSDEWGVVCGYRSYYAAWTVCRQLGYHDYGNECTVLCGNAYIH